MNKYNNNKYNNNKCFMLNKWINFNYEVKSQIITFRTILRALRKFKIYLSTLNFNKNKSTILIQFKVKNNESQ